MAKIDLDDLLDPRIEQAVRAVEADRRSRYDRYGVGPYGDDWAAWTEQNCGYEDGREGMAFDLVDLPILGWDATRIVFALDGKRVLKVGLDKWGWRANNVEYSVWSSAKGRLRKLLAGVRSAAPMDAYGRRWLIMDRAEPLVRLGEDAVLATAELERLGLDGAASDADRAEQWGRIDGRLVLLDYGET